MQKIELNDLEAFTFVDSLRLLAPIKSIILTSEATLGGNRKILSVVAVDGKVSKLDITDYGSW